MSDAAFRNVRLQAIATAFVKRGKSLRYQGELEIVRLANDESESLEVNHSFTLSGWISLSIGAGGDWSLIASKRRPGRTGGRHYKLELLGRFDGHTPEQIVSAFAGSISHATDREQRRNDLVALWQPIDVRG